MSTLEDLLAEFWALREGGDAVSVDEFVARHPEHGAALRAALTAMLDASQMLPEADVPASIGGYVVQRRLGHGATGEVFAVTDDAGRRFALKRLLPHAAVAMRAQQRLWREADVLRGLDHPGIVDVVEIGQDDTSQVPFLVMELVEGTTLSAWIEAAQEHGRERAAGKLLGPGDSWQRIARCAAAIADAVETAHTAGILHRDLKPGNVLVRTDGTPVVIDFGLAADEGAATLTGTGDLLGTPHYMAPEQARGVTATKASDVYGLGAILSELLTLHPPRIGSDALQVLEHARRLQPASPRAVAPEVPRELDLITRRAMAFREQHRYRSAGELARALEHVAAGGRPIGLTLSLSQRADDFWRNRRGAVLGATAAILVAALAWFVIDLQHEAHAEKVRAAMIAAFESHLDGDDEAIAAAAKLLDDSGEPALVKWLQGGPPDDDPFVVELATGQALARVQPKAAMQHLQAAVDLRPDLAIASGWLGLAALRAEDNTLAERELTAAVRSLPNSIRLRHEFGRMLRRSKRGADAVVHLEYATTLPGANWFSWHELAKARIVDHQYDGALEAVDEALARADAPRQRISALRTKGIIFDAMKRHADALPIMEKILELRPSPSARMSYGVVLDKLHRIREAREVYYAVATDHPDNAHALLNLAYLHGGANPDCEQCQAYFVANPDLLDPELVDEFATKLLRLQTDEFGIVETLAGYLKRSGGGTRFLAAIDELLTEDHSAESLGHLLRARRIVQDK